MCMSLIVSDCAKLIESVQRRLPIIWLSLFDRDLRPTCFAIYIGQTLHVRIQGCVPCATQERQKRKKTKHGLQFLYLESRTTQNVVNASWLHSFVSWCFARVVKMHAAEQMAYIYGQI